MSKLLSPRVLVPTAIVIVVLVVFSLYFPRVVLPDISIPAEVVLEFSVFGIHIALTNTLLAAWLTMLVLIVGSWLITRKMETVPGRWQGFYEMVIEGFYNMVEGAAGPKWARRFFPIVMTIFLFVVLANWLGLTPLYNGWGVLHHAEHGEGAAVNWLDDDHKIGIWMQPEDLPEGQSEVEGAHAETSEGEGAHAEGGETYKLAPMLRAPSTDLNFTLALAIVSVLLTQYFGFQALGLGYFGKFIALPSILKAFRTQGVGCSGRLGLLGMGLIDLFIGIVELISEIGKVVSFSFRLFGNIFAGEVLLGVMAFLIPYIVSLPFYGLEIFVGLVQALVFMMLTVAFFVVAISHHGEEEH
ncbi:MAG: FoF1 ATP synthase subunit a [Anaerolineae bacterium]